MADQPKEAAKEAPRVAPQGAPPQRRRDQQKGPQEEQVKGAVQFSPATPAQVEEIIRQNRHKRRSNPNKVQGNGWTR